MEGNASVYQVNPVSRITGEGRAELLRTWGPGFDQKGGGRGGGGGRDGWGSSIIMYGGRGAQTHGPEKPLSCCRRHLLRN